MSEELDHDRRRFPAAAAMTVTDRRFEIEFLDPGAEAFAFTFG